MLMDYRQGGRRLRERFLKEERQFSTRYQAHGNREPRRGYVNSKVNGNGVWGERQVRMVP